eukprot:2362578-Lingulodinium_polyedra.AAC.1
MPPVETTEETEHMSTASMAATDGDTDAPLVKRARATSAETTIWCAHCNMWLNGPEQIDDHIKGKKHNNNTTRERADRDA